MSESKLESMRESLGEPTSDLKLNISSVLEKGTLDESQRWVVAISSAYFVRDLELANALIEEASDRLNADLIDDAKAAAAIMAMNTVYYRFRHMVGKESYEKMRVGLRMSRLMKPATSKEVFELCSMACAAIAGCEMCIHSHEETLLKHGISEEQIHDSVRIGAVVNGFSTSLAIDK